MEVFKVVKKHEEHCYHSWAWDNLDKSARVLYQLDHKTFHAKEHLPLCAFPDIFRANWFISTYSYLNRELCVILRCEAEISNRHQLPYCAFPETTIFCSSITPLEVMKDYSK